MKKILIILAVAATLAIGFLIWPRGQEKVEPIAEKPGLIKVFMPKPSEVIESPLTIEGEARGFWFFEASFPVRIYDDNGNELGVIPAQAQGEWMTTEFVPFKAMLEFKNPATERGMLVLEKDNPSGLPEYADELRIPIKFY